MEQKTYTMKKYIYISGYIYYMYGYRYIMDRVFLHLDGKGKGGGGNDILNVFSNIKRTRNARKPTQPRFYGFTMIFHLFHQKND